MSDFHIISAPSSQSDHTGALEHYGVRLVFPFKSSTPAYPMWQLGILSSVDSQLHVNILRSLVQIESTSDAAVLGGYASWVPTMVTDSMDMLDVVGRLKSDGYCSPDDPVAQYFSCPAGTHARLPQESCHIDVDAKCPRGFECVCKPCVQDVPDDKKLISVWAENVTHRSVWGSQDGYEKQFVACLESSVCGVGSDCKLEQLEEMSIRISVGTMPGKELPQRFTWRSLEFGGTTKGGYIEGQLEKIQGNKGEYQGILSFASRGTKLVNITSSGTSNDYIPFVFVVVVEARACLWQRGPVWADSDGQCVCYGFLLPTNQCVYAGVLIVIVLAPLAAVLILFWAARGFMSTNFDRKKAIIQVIDPIEVSDMVGCSSKACTRHGSSTALLLRS